MSEQPKSKGLFDAALNLVSNRDEKAAIEALQKHVADLENELAEAKSKATGLAQRADIAERKAAQLEASMGKGQTDSQAALVKLQAELDAAKAANAALEQRLSRAEAKAQLYDAEQKRLQMEDAAQDAAKAAVLTMHTLTSEETLSHLALKYYGHATEPYWRIIYEANKDVIGEKPNRVRAGMVVKIPVLPADMKK